MFWALVNFNTKSACPPAPPGRHLLDATRNPPAPSVLQRRFRLQSGSVARSCRPGPGLARCSLAAR
eukprot:8430069-Pyramimonas_sp.AAC.1